jgi:hypothetical protein
VWRRGVFGLEEVQRLSVGNCLRAAFNAQFAKNMIDVLLDSQDADHELFRDFLVRIPSREQSQGHLENAW